MKIGGPVADKSYKSVNGKNVRMFACPVSPHKRASKDSDVCACVNVKESEGEIKLMAASNRHACKLVTHRYTRTKY